jgi:hypothetical protein
MEPVNQKFGLSVVRQTLKVKKLQLEEFSWQLMHIMSL